VETNLKLDEEPLANTARHDHLNTLDAHPMSDIITQFKVLKLYGMAAYRADLQNNGTPGATVCLDRSAGLLHQLIQTE